MVCVMNLVEGYRGVRLNPGRLLPHLVFVEVTGEEGVMQIPMPKERTVGAMIFRMSIFGVLIRKI